MLVSFPGSSWLYNYFINLLISTLRRGRVWFSFENKMFPTPSQPDERKMTTLVITGNTKWGSITVLLTSCLTGLESAV
jgi:hypothetical protein